jgi:hypothetical protein
MKKKHLSSFLNLAFLKIQIRENPVSTGLALSFDSKEVNSIA